jgi:M-phase inducer tyrosine phosphatase
VYILDGGYSAFFGEHRSRCVPQNYIGMNSTDHVNTCEREMGKLRHRKKLNRAQTFAFGQYQHPVDDSPTAPGRAVTNMMMTTLENRRMHTQRMASY